MMLNMEAMLYDALMAEIRHAVRCASVCEEALAPRLDCRYSFWLLETYPSLVRKATSAGILLAGRALHPLTPKDTQTRRSS